MGQELECRMRLGKRSLAGKAYLETDFFLFRGDERLKVLFKDLRSVTAKSGVLRLDFDGGPAELELGKAADKWADKILNPPSRADKLGVKPGTLVRLVGDFDPGFLDELKTRSASLVEKGAEIVFYRAEKAAALKKVAKLAPAGNAALWVIFPKGVAAIREMDVLEAGRAAGLKDVKVASFSATHTGLKFVLPVSKR
jgi:hypothetical protein